MRTLAKCDVTVSYVAANIRRPSALDGSSLVGASTEIDEELDKEHSPRMASCSPFSCRGLDSSDARLLQAVECVIAVDGRHMDQAP